MRYTTSTLALLSLSAVAAASPNTHDARSRAMGGTGVASSDYLSALFQNPALLTNFDESDDFGLMLPTVGVFVSDPDDMIDKTEEFVDEFDDLEDQVNAIDDLADLTQPQIDALRADLNSLADTLESLDNRVLQFDVDAGLGFANPSKDLAWGILVQTHVSARAFVSVSDADVTAIREAADGDSGPPDGLPTDLSSNARVSAGGIADYGVALATTLDLGGTEIAVGVTPKVQVLQTFNYVVDANEFDSDDSESDFDNEANRNEKEGFNIDAGASMAIGEELTVGLVLRNLIERELESERRFGRKFTYQVQPRATAGVAWATGAWTLTADLDLNETKEFKEIAIPASRFVGVGAELAGSWAQLRAGYRMDTENVYEDVLTGGIGLSPFDVFHIDLTGMVGDQTYGAALQLSWTF